MNDRLFYDDCFITKYKKLKGLVHGTSCDSILPLRCTEKATHNVDYFSHKLTESQLHQCWKIVHHRGSLRDVKWLNKLHQDENMVNKVEDLMLLIPSTSSKRLENSSWRAWLKERFQLSELDPAELNWFKENDITWLYGPLILSEEEELEQNKKQKQKQQPINTNQNGNLWRSSSSESLSSLSSNESLSSVDTASTSITSDDLVNFHSKPLIKPILKGGNSISILQQQSVGNTLSNKIQRRMSFSEIYNNSNDLNRRRKKRVSFSSIMEKREIINDEIFDYNMQFIDNERVGFGYYSY